MYANPRHIRTAVMSFRLTEDNRKRLEERAEKLRTQPGTLAREMFEAVLECEETCNKVIELLDL